MAAWHRRPHSLLAAISIVAIAGSFAACGGSDDSKLLTAGSAAELRSTLAGVDQRVENGDCEGAQEQVALLDQQVTSLDGVDADLRDALASGVSRLQQLVANECQAPVDTGTTDTGTTDTGGTTAPDEEQSDESGKDKGKEKEKSKEDQGQDEGGDESQSGTGGQDGGSTGGTTGTGGVAP